MAFLQIDYKSEALMRGVNIKVILPSDGMAGKWEPPYKTLYLLPDTNRHTKTHPLFSPHNNP